MNSLSFFLLKNYSRFFARPFFRGLNTFLFRLGTTGLGIHSHSSGERYFYKKILPHLVKDSQPVFIDAGAFIGRNSELLKKIFPGAFIYLFEPNPRCYEMLRKIETPEIKTFNIALGKKSEKRKLFDRKSNDLTMHSSLYHEVISDIHESEFVEYETEVTTLDKFTDLHSLEHIDFLKIDTEGNELNILKGANKIIKNSSLDIIQFEFNSMNVISRTHFHDFRQLLQEYKLYRMLPKGIIELENDILNTELFGLQNIVAISNRLNIEKNILS